MSSRPADRTRSALCAAVGTALLVGCTPEPKVLTHRVVKQSFLHDVRAEGHLSAAEVTTIQVPAEVRRAAYVAWLVDDASTVDKGDLVARFDATEMRERIADGSDDLTTNSLRTTKTAIEGHGRTAVTKKDADIASRELLVASEFQRTDEDVYSRFERLESQIDTDLAEDRLDHAARMGAIQQQLSTAEVAVLSAARQKVQLEIDEARHNLSVLEVRAPKAGLLTLARDHRGEPLQVGSQVWRGQDLAEIPDLSDMKAELFVLESDAGGLEVGRDATIRLMSHPEISVAGTIDQIEPVAKPRDRGSPVQFFAVKVSLKETLPGVMRPGQRVEGTLHLARLDEAIVIPRQAVELGEGAVRVWVRTGRRFASREVELGRQTAGRAVVLSGLEEGDVVALETPTHELQSREEGGDVATAERQTEPTKEAQP